MYFYSHLCWTICVCLCDLDYVFFITLSPMLDYDFTCVSMSALVPLNVYVCMHVCIKDHVCALAWIHEFLPICKYMHVWHVCVCVCACVLCICMCVHFHACMHVHRHLCVCMCVCVYACMCVSGNVYVCVCVYISTGTNTLKYLPSR